MLRQGCEKYERKYKKLREGSVQEIKHAILRVPDRTNKGEEVGKLTIKDASRVVQKCGKRPCSGP